MQYASSTRVLPALVALVALAALPSCDSGGASDSDFQFLEGSWAVVEIEINGQSYQSLLETRYPDGTVFAFTESDGLRTFRLVGAADGGNRLEIEGTVSIDGEEDVLFLDGSSNVFVVIGYDIASSDRVALTATGQDAVVLARALLGVNVSQDSRLSITILQNE